MKSGLPFWAIFALILVAEFSTLVCAQTSGWPPASGHATLELWPHGVPGGTVTSGSEGDTSTANDYLVAGKAIVRLANVSTPTITLYEAKRNPSGIAVVVFPGGGYHILAMDLEGTEVCDWLNSINITCVLVKYRVPDTGPYPKSPAALQDAQRAVGIVRSHAADWHINPSRIGVLGFSAGGHLTGALATHFDNRLYDPVDFADNVSCRPDFTVLVYPAYLSAGENDVNIQPEIKVTAQTPPAFIVQAEDDHSYIASAIAYFEALRKAKVPAELHIYAEGGHGYGLRPTDMPVTHWPALAEAWFKTIGLIK